MNAEMTRAEVLLAKIEALKTELLAEAEGHSEGGRQGDVEECTELWGRLNELVTGIEDDYGV